jgi:hypothetical protein
MAFVKGNSLRLMKRDLDEAHQDTQHKKFNKDFRIELLFKRIKVKSTISHPLTFVETQACRSQIGIYFRLQSL